MYKKTIVVIPENWESSYHYKIPTVLFSKYKIDWPNPHTQKPMLKNTLSGETITKTLYLKLYNNNADQPRIFKPNLYRINLTYVNPAATKKIPKTIPIYRWHFSVSHWFLIRSYTHFTYEFLISYSKNSKINIFCGCLTNISFILSCNWPCSHLSFLHLFDIFIHLNLKKHVFNKKPFILHNLYSSIWIQKSKIMPLYP